jgi:hypothetical protein
VMILMMTLRRTSSPFSLMKMTMDTCMYEYAMHIDKYCNRAEYRQPTMSGLDWVERKLTNRTTTCLE